MEPITLKLTTPIQAHGEELLELEIRPPTTKTLRIIDEAKGSIDAAIRMIVDLAGIPTSSVEAMHPADFAAASKAINGFLEPFLSPGSDS